MIMMCLADYLDVLVQNSSALVLDGVGGGKCSGSRQFSWEVDIQKVDRLDRPHIKSLVFLNRLSNRSGGFW
jgi:hypothetical protein